MKEVVYPHMIVNGGFFDWGIFPGYWDKLFRRDVLEKYLNAVDERIMMGEDASCIYPCLLNSESIYVLHRCLYHYRQTQGSMVHITRKNVTIERERFRVLYTSTLKVLSSGSNIFDMTEQWLYYVLFLMMPRADILYKDLDKLEYLFPYPEVKRGEKVIVYGAGLFGQRIYEYIRQTEFCVPVALADRDYERLRMEGINVVSPDDMSKYDWDAIAQQVTEIYHSL